MTAVILDQRARAVIERDSLKRRLRETGGSLFGWEDEGTIHVACASGPGPGAKHGPRSFAPAPATVAAAMARVQSVSEGRYRYVGSWHTHPLSAARPSATDSATARAMAEQPDLLLPRPLVLIVATTGTKRHIRVGELAAWTWTARTGKLAKAEITTVEFPERYCPAAELLYAYEEDVPAPDARGHTSGSRPKSNAI
jgi:integrative and conjugative element protein (TIGR02256 family)